MMLQTATPPEFNSDTPEDRSERSDQELIAAANAGDPDAFAALYSQHKDWVLNLAFRFTRDRELSLDVLQDTFVYFWKKFPGFRLTAQLKTFLYPVVKNLSLSISRKASRHSPATPELEERMEAPPELALHDGATVQKAIESLSQPAREVLELRFVEEFSLDEIAAALEIPLGTVKSRLHNALTTLRKDPRTRGFFED
jgi:RNA polymerase sigma-70 factor (ECF subfamily)